MFYMEWVYSESVILSKLISWCCLVSAWPKFLFHPHCLASLLLMSSPWSLVFWFFIVFNLVNIIERAPSCHVWITAGLSKVYDNAEVFGYQFWTFMCSPARFFWCSYKPIQFANKMVFWSLENRYWLWGVVAEFVSSTKGQIDY